MKFERRKKPSPLEDPRRHAPLDLLARKLTPRAIEELRFIAEGKEGRRNADHFRLNVASVTGLERRALVSTVRDFRWEGDYGPLVSVAITERGRALLAIVDLEAARRQEAS